jgi:hypothetical protein
MIYVCDGSSKQRPAPALAVDTRAQWRRWT